MFYLAKVTIDSNLKLNPELIIVIAEETNVKEVIFDHKTDLLNVILDTDLTKELIAEGEYRDLIRSIQVLRREANLAINDSIKIFAPTWPKDFEDQILKKTLAVSIEIGDILKVEKA